MVKVLVLVLLLTMTSAMSAAAARSPFIGSWESIDLDGSYMILTVGAGDPTRVAFIDTFATMCVKAGAHEGPGTLRGAGVVTSNTMVVDFDKLRCTNNVVLFPNGLTLEFRYEPATDTLFGSDVIWYRVPARSL